MIPYKTLIEKKIILKFNKYVIFHLFLAYLVLLYFYDFIDTGCLVQLSI